MANHPIFVWQFVVLRLCTTRKNKVYHFPIYGYPIPIYNAVQHNGPIAPPLPIFNWILGRSFNLWRFVCSFVPCLRGICGEICWEPGAAVMRYWWWWWWSSMLTVVVAPLHLFWFVWNNNRCLLNELHILTCVRACIIIHCRKLLMVDNRFSSDVCTPLSPPTLFSRSQAARLGRAVQEQEHGHGHGHTNNAHPVYYYYSLFGQITIV